MGAQGIEEPEEQEVQGMREGALAFGKDGVTPVDLIGPQRKDALIE